MTKRRFFREVGRAISWHRRLLAAALAAASAAAVIHLTQPAPPETVQLLVADRDLSGGSELAEDDLRQIAVPPEAVPDGAVRPGDSLSDQVLASPLRAGEPLTNVRLVRPDLAASYGDDLVAAPTRIFDQDATHVLRVGDRVDVLATSTTIANADVSDFDEAVSEEATTTIARDVPVVAIPPAEATGVGAEGALVVLAVSPDIAEELAHYHVSARLSIVLRGAA